MFECQRLKVFALMLQVSSFMVASSNGPCTDRYMLIVRNHLPYPYQEIYHQRIVNCLKMQKGSLDSWIVYNCLHANCDQNNPANSERNLHAAAARIAQDLNSSRGC